VKRKQHQFEFCWGPEPMKLLTETTQDGERICRERVQQERDRAENDTRQEKMGYGK